MLVQERNDSQAKHASIYNAFTYRPTHFQLLLPFKSTVAGTFFHLPYPMSQMPLLQNDSYCLFDAGPRQSILRNGGF